MTSVVTKSRSAREGQRCKNELFSTMARFTEVAKEILDRNSASVVKSEELESSTTCPISARLQKKN